MPPPKRLLHAAALQTSSPPDALPAHHAIAQVVRGAGNNLFEARFASAPAPGADEPATTRLVEMPARFRRAIWVRNGGYVVVDTAALNGARENKLAGEIVNVVRGVEGWRRMGYWPKEFSKQMDEYDSDSGEDGESSDGEVGVGRGGQGKNVGEMPPSESEGEEENDSWRARGARPEVVYKVAEEAAKGGKK